MKNYREMSDFEINKAVAINSGFDESDVDLAYKGKPLIGVEWNDDTGMPVITKDYCNNPSDAWPIIESNGISIYHFAEDARRGSWAADAPAGTPFSYGDSALRAAMIVYLMMKDAEK